MQSADPLLVVAYIWRPHVLAPDDLANKELELQEKTAELLELVTLLKRERTNLNDGTGKAKRAIRLRYMTDRLEVNKLTQMVFLLERDLEQLNACKVARHGYNPLKPYAYLIAGVNNINFFMVFFRNNVFVWMLMLIAFLMLLYLFIRPRDVATSTEDFRRGLYSRSQVADNAYDALGTKEAEMTKV
eukprot:scaffold1160_cov174-Ochromonas_danica.AAC.14